MTFRSRIEHCVLAGFVVTAAVGTAALLFVPRDCVAAPLGFEPSVVVSASLAYRPSLATDDAGTWIAVWGQAEQTGGYARLQVARSFDNAQSWSAPEFLNSTPEYTASHDIGTDGAGSWVIIWRTSPSVSAQQDVVYSYSTDNGATWSASTTLDTSAGYAVTPPSIESNGAGRWVASWMREVDYEPGTTVVSYTDDLFTWTSPATLVDHAAQVEIDTDGAGVWVAAFLLPDGVHVRRSVDNGATWLPALLVDGSGARIGTVLTDGAGTWLISYVSETSNSNDDALVVRSSDNGATWSSPADVDVNTAESTGTSGKPWITMTHDAASGTWAAFWAADGQPFRQDRHWEIFYARSVDGGQSWSLPAVANPEGDGDGRAYIESGATASNDSGTTVLMYTKQPNPGCCVAPALLRTVARPTCASTPLTTCKDADKSLLRIASKPGGGDSLRWKWKGEATSMAELGQPDETSAYTACLYESGATDLAFEKDIPAGGVCGDEACWTASTTGFTYEDRRLARSSVRKLSLASGANGRAAISLFMKGSSLDPPDLPLAGSPSTVLQLVNEETGACWQSVLSATVVNTAGKFIAR